MFKKNQKQKLALRIFAIYAGFLAFVISTFSLQFYITGELPFTVYPPILALFTSVTAWLIAKQQRTEIALWIFNLGILLSILWSASLQPALASFPFNFVVVPIIISSLLQKPFATAVNAFIQISAIVVLSLIIEEIPGEIIVSIAFVSIISLLGLIYQTQRRKELDNTERTQKLLEKSEEMLRLSIDATGDGAWDWDIASGKVCNSERWAELLGYSAHDLERDYQEWISMVHPDDQAQLEAAISEHIDGKTPRFDTKYRIRRSDQSYCWISSRGKIVSRGTDNKALRMVGVITDISLEMSQQIQLRESEQQLKEAQTIGNIGSWYFDLIAQKITMSDQSLRIYGIQEGDKSLSGNNFLKYVHPEDLSILADSVNQCLASGEPYEFVYRVTRPTGELVYVRVNGHRVDEASGKPIALQGTCQDVSTFIKQQQQLENAIAKSKEAAEAKARFLANMSHEIRTPLNSVLGYAELLADSPLNYEQSQYLQIMQTAGKHLLEVVNDILDYSKIDSGKIHIEYQPFDIRQKVQSLIAIHQHEVNSKGLDLRIQLAENFPHFVRSDELRFAQILSNLISNAIKFTDHGQVELIARVKEDNAEDQILLFDVKDTGLGISEDDQSKLFRSFSQVDSSISRRYGGSGLGLVIAKRLSRLLGGELWFSSTYKQGSCFSFTIRTLKSNDQSINTPKVAAPSITSFQAPTEAVPRILIVEDNPINQQLAKAILRKLGFQADIVDNGRKALEAQKLHHYQIIFMDVQMPEMDGIEATRNLRKTWSSEQVKIIAMTANALDQDREVCLQAGMDAFVSKPFSKTDLAEALNQILYKKGSNDKHQLVS